MLSLIGGGIAVHCWGRPVHNNYGGTRFEYMHCSGQAPCQECLSWHLVPLASRAQSRHGNRYVFNTSWSGWKGTNADATYLQISLYYYWKWTNWRSVTIWSRIRSVNLARVLMMTCSLCTASEGLLSLSCDMVTARRGSILWLQASKTFSKISSTVGSTWCSSLVVFYFLWSF